MALIERHVDFVEALRAAGLPVSLAEDIDAGLALTSVDWSDREVMRAAYGATLVKRQSHRTTFDAIFDLFYPALLGSGVEVEDGPDDVPLRDGAQALEDLRDRLAEVLASTDAQAAQRLAREAVGTFGAMPGRGPGMSSWSSHQAMQRVDPESLVERVLLALGIDPLDHEARAEVTARVRGFRRLAEADARRRIAEEKGPEHVARSTLRPNVDRLDFISLRQDDLAEMRRQIQPLARRLATRLTKEAHASRGRSLDFRRTVRASMSTGGVPITTHHKPRRPHRSELVVLCDVSGSVANFAQFTLLLVFALREQFTKVRAFTFVDTVHEVTDHFVPGADVAEVMTELAASVRHAALWGRTNYGRAFTTFNSAHPEALGPRSSLLILGDARSNHSELALDELRRMAGASRHSWWLNPEHGRHWGTGDSAAVEYGEVVAMVECRNLTQLGEFVHDLV
ncbi:vWA domain-containing protein [Nocardioides sp.]|uniref:vWA domain-containing protein n=1 Tax=Nocardioides sp. TaxID=35761 RepID=UPI003D0E3231